MKKKIVIAALALLAVGASIAWASVRCAACKGTGFNNGGTGPVACPTCRGTGFYGGY